MEGGEADGDGVVGEVEGKEGEEEGVNIEDVDEVILERYPCKIRASNWE
jgi:hypothetical protein